MIKRIEIHETKNLDIYFWYHFMCDFDRMYQKDERGQKQKVVYVVCRRSVIPVQLGKLIDEQKREAFHFTYTTGGFTYYVIGYGRQPGSGYKIKVREFSADRTHIYIDTILTGVTKEHQKHGKSYPYIVLKSQFYEKDVIFH